MANNDKTEKATPQRRNQARRDGQVARSAEVPTFVGLAMAALTLRVFVPSSIDEVGRATSSILTHLSGDPQLLGDASRVFATVTLAVVAPFLGAAMLAGLGAGFGQTKFLLSMKAAKPKLSAISPKQGIKRFAPRKAGWELARTALKIGALTAVAWEPMSRVRERLTTPTGLGIDAVLGIVVDEVWTLLIRAIALAMLIAAADYAYQKWSFDRDLRMTKTEVKQEHKNSEGDPVIKGERRRRQAALSRNRMLADVTHADVVLVNPTDYAIALRYDPADPAPRVLAKGAGHLAARIRAEATRHGVPIHVDVPLCRALYRQVEVGGLVPQAMFDAIAVVLVWAYRRTRRGPRSGPPSSAMQPARRGPRRSRRPATARRPQRRRRSGEVMLGGDA